VSSAVLNSESKQGSPRTGKRFPRSSRLLKHPLFDRVYKGGKRQFSGLMTVFFLRRAGEGNSSNEQNRELREGPRVGLTVGRVLGNSVVRNRIRRRMREAVRFNLDVLPDGVDVVINPKKQVLDAQFATLTAEVDKAFRSVAKRLNQDREQHRDPKSS
jgi:ribonuclease P protein component